MGYKQIGPVFSPLQETLSLWKWTETNLSSSKAVYYTNIPEKISPEHELCLQNVQKGSDPWETVYI